MSQIPARFAPATPSSATPASAAASTALPTASPPLAPEYVAPESVAPDSVVPAKPAPSRNVEAHAYAVEVDDTTVGIVIRESGNDFTFIAATRAFYPLDQQRFASPAAAQRAALALHCDRRGTLRSFAAR